ncbi:MAG: hypothetical protein JW982_16825 [Spirochaetes bacterium]|nr:hypothetical protein [Spirochaetota bacterium]
MGYKIPYRLPTGLYSYFDRITPQLSSPDKNINGVYQIDGSPVYPDKYGIFKGDVIHFKKHIAIFAEDRGVKGVLDADDLVINSIGISPHYCSIKKTGYYHLPVSVFRWKEI